MKHFILSVFFIAALAASVLLCSTTANATHILGGGLSYKHISDSIYKVTLTLYSDCSPASENANQFLTSAMPEINLIDNNVQYGTFHLACDHAASAIELAIGCSQPPVTQCTNITSVMPGVKEYVYTGLIVLPHQSANWKFVFFGQLTPYFVSLSWSITNVAYSSSITVCHEASLNSFLNNSTALYGGNLQPYYCINTANEFVPWSLDSDGDSLVYRLIPAPAGYAAGSGGSAALTYVSPYTPTHPMSATAFLHNTSTGVLSFIPNLLQKALVAYQVSEYRAGVLVGRSDRQIVITVLPCTDKCTAAVGIEQNQADNNIKLYPNPAGDLLNIDMPDLQYNQVIIRNILGEAVIQQLLSAHHTAVATTALPAGIYFITLKGQNTQKVEMITIQK